jgi:hypothetical protein
MNKPSAYTTDREVEEIMKYQSSWDIVDPEPAEKNPEKVKARIPSVISRDRSTWKTSCQGT